MFDSLFYGYEFALYTELGVRHFFASFADDLPYKRPLLLFLPEIQHLVVPRLVEITYYLLQRTAQDLGAVRQTRNDYWLFRLLGKLLTRRILILTGPINSLLIWGLLFNNAAWVSKLSC